ncbi:MAG: HEAT repeat domain-containing protein, partial [Spirulinaceae cyanobacterium]
MLDALDEVPKDQRQELKDKLNRFAKYYPCPIICTSRIVGYGGSFIAGGKDVEIVPFNQGQTEKYIETWFKNAEESLSVSLGKGEEKDISASGLIEELRQKPQISGLAQNPLLLSLLCSLYQEKGITLPAKRGQVYEKAVEYMLSQWRKDNRRLGAESGWVVAKTELLEFLAYEFSCQSQEVFELRELREKIEEFLRGDCGSDFRNVTATELIGELTEEDGIIQKLDRDGNKYLFLHRTFQEYLTAAYLNYASNGVALAKEHFWDFDWHETLTLLAGLMKDPLPLLQAIMGEKDDIFRTLLLLAGRCVAEGKEVEDASVGRIVEEVYQFWLAYPDAEFVTSVVVIFAEISNAQAVEALITALNHSDSNVKWIAAKALGKIGNAQGVEALIAILNDSESYFRSSAADALGKIGNAQAVKALIAALDHSDIFVIRSAADVLGQTTNPQGVEALIAALDDSDSNVRKIAASALGQIGNAQGVEEALIAALDDFDSNVKLSAALALDQIGNPQGVKALITALDDSDSNVKWIAAKALGKIGNTQGVKALITALYDSNSDVRRIAANALGKIDNAQVVEALITALYDSNSDVRR